MLDGIEEEMAVGLGHAEQYADGLHRELGGHVDQKVTLVVDGFDQPTHSTPQLLLQVADGRRRQPPGHQAPDARVTGVVHHVEHDARHREILNDRAPVRSVASRLRGIGHGVVQHLEHLVIGGHRPEALPVGGVDGGLVPPDGRLLPMQAEDVVREAAGEGVEIGQIHLAEVTNHGVILTTISHSVKNGAQGA